MAWIINYAETARKELLKLDKQVALRIINFMSERIAKSDDPRQIGKALTGLMSDLWCYRVGDYRIICDIKDESLCVLVLKIGNRNKVYRE